jgi:hypothetical protein
VRESLRFDPNRIKKKTTKTNLVQAKYEPGQVEQQENEDECHHDPGQRNIGRGMCESSL